DVLDITHLAVSLMVENKALLNRMFLECGQKELIFIERSGFYFGFLFGLFQTLAWWFYPEGWVLPVGILTNWLALKIIFQPVEPVRVCGLFTAQGLFLLRQTEVSAAFAKINAAEVLNSEHLWQARPLSHVFEEKCRLHVNVFLDAMAGPLRPLVVAYLGKEEFHEVKDHIAAEIPSSCLSCQARYANKYTDQSLDLETTLRVAMQNLSSKEFEGVLHPVFEEDELKLIVVGGALGAAVGVLQLAFMF
ncbi:unnamed protein product, partial [Phaeothamnion confervicola]